MGGTEIVPRPDDSVRLGNAETRAIRDRIWSERIIRAYFSDPARRMKIRRGGKILRQNEPNDKLYYIVEGRFMCSMLVDSPSGDKALLELYPAREGEFVGARSFFSDTGLAVFDAAAECDSVVMWMGRDAGAVDQDRYGSIREQFFPVIMRELEQRQWRLTRVARARVSDRIRLHKAEDMATLGQFAAGLAHELNNATSVLMSSSQHLDRQLLEYFRQYAPDLAPWYERGTRLAGSLSSAEVRARARDVAKRHAIDYESAKDLVRMTGGEEIEAIPRDVESLRSAWMTGRSCRDIVTASKHAAGVIHSIKQLAGGGHARREVVDVAESLEQARELLQDSLKDVEVKMDIEAGLPGIKGNIGELMQIWLNLMKNACEAMRDAHTPSPRITVTAGREGEGVCVRICDNGPGIPQDLQEKIFSPFFSTKDKGSGLGLAMTRKIINEIGGKLLLHSQVGHGTLVSISLRPLLAVEDDAALLSGAKT
jgi:signal transduction histidine kinase